MSACDKCVRRAWLIGALSGNLEIAWLARKPLRDILAITDSALIQALGGDGRETLSQCHESLRPAEQVVAWEAQGVACVCRHDPRYPQRLRAIPDAPAVLFCAGDVEHLSLVGGSIDDGPPVASVVGTRRPLPEADEFARGLGRGLAASGVAVVSGMALGIDSSAHAGALDVSGPTIAVLACGPERAYPVSKSALHRRLVAEQLVISELPPGSGPRRWGFPARNRTIAALGTATIVVQAAERSGSLITADFATAMGRDVGSVPGRAGSSRTRGGNKLLRDGAAVILDTEDALDLVLGFERAIAPAPTLNLEPRLASLLEAVAGGDDSLAALSAGAASPEQIRAGLVELELLGLVRRAHGDRYVSVLR
jgi:DNA processing protein